jgi:hypothetical protein
MILIYFPAWVLFSHNVLGAFLLTPRTAQFRAVLPLIVVTFMYRRLWSVVAVVGVVKVLGTSLFETPLT